MNYPDYVKLKPWVLEFLPWTAGPAFTIYPHIYLPEPIYRDLQSHKPTPGTLATLAHERVHLQRQRMVGILMYACRYLFSRKFRYEEELTAIRAQVKILHSHGVWFDIEDRARRLSSSEYLWCAAFTQARQDLSFIVKHEAHTETF